MKKSTNAVLFNFSDLGYDRWCQIHPVEMDIIWHGAQDLIYANDENATRAMLALTKAKLIAKSSKDDITEDWITTALLCTAIDGILDGKLPRYSFDVG